MVEYYNKIFFSLLAQVRILGFKGGESQFGEFPWVATLLKKEFVMGKEVPLFVGGASLIHKRVALTAAHKIVE